MKKEILIGIARFLKRYNYAQDLKDYEIELELKVKDEKSSHTLKLRNSNKKIAFEGIKHLEALFKEESSFLFDVNIHDVSEYTFHLKDIDGKLKVA